MDKFRMPLSKNILFATISDLIHDFEELLYLYNSNIITLNHFAKTISKVSSSLPIETSTIAFQYIKKYQLLFETNSKKIKFIKDLLIEKANIDIQRFINLKGHFYNILRTYQEMFGSLLTSLDWQSPSFSHSLFSQAGKQTGQIKLSLTDYKRDHHIDEKGYERSFIKEYVDAPLKFPLVSYVTNSGMSAFSTLLFFLLGEKKLKGNILIGNSIYFQNKTLLKSISDIKLHTVDESNYAEIIHAMQKVHPIVIIFDSLTNTNGVIIPDLYSLLKSVVKQAKQEIIFIIDNTCLATAFQPFPIVVGKTGKVQLYMFESLLKYHQFGIDRINTGIIYGYGKDAYKLFYYRRDMGSNISDSAVNSLTIPNRKFLERRLARLNRNATSLALFLQNTISNLKSHKLQHINYPLLPHHPSYTYTQTLPFAGSFFTLQFTPKYAGIKTYRRFLDLAIKEARKKGIPMVGGTSFGFNTTRIYPVALRTTETIPFLRVSVGTETIYEVHKLQEVLFNTIQQL